MKPEDRDYVRFRLSQAQDALEDVRILLERDRRQAAVNRLYYACFYAVTALLFTEGHAAGRHRGLQVLFDRHCVASGRLPHELGRFFHRMFDQRQRGDYGKAPDFNRSDIEAWYDQARHFIARVSAEAERNLQSGNPEAE